MTGNDLDPQLAASMRRAIVRHAAAHRTTVRSPRRRIATVATATLIAGVAVAAVFIAISTTGFPVLQGAPLAATPETIRVNGFDAQEVYHECIDVAQVEFPIGISLFVTPGPFTDDSVRPGPDTSVRGQTPESEWSTTVNISVLYTLKNPDSAQETRFTIVCTATGSPDNPTVTYSRGLD